MKSIKFKESWSAAIAQFSSEVRCEIYAATVFYTLENCEPENLSDLARGAFAFIKADIDATRRRTAEKCAKTDDPAPENGTGKEKESSDAGVAQADPKRENPAGDSAAEPGRRVRCRIVPPESRRRGRRKTRRRAVCSPKVRRKKWGSVPLFRVLKAYRSFPAR
ncbi:MAG: hypothetical protein K2F63_02710 [Muribaculaceae bacterium]|nr:hypothetical protein [Muribaculaceae bacterium]